MIILTLRTDKPEAELGVYDNDRVQASVTWHAHRALAETLHRQLDALLTKQSLSLADLRGIVCYAGPGSFTGLRIGMTVANALAYSYSIPVVATNNHGENSWQHVGIARILAGETDHVAIPVYGAPAIVTTPKN